MDTSVDEEFRPVDDILKSNYRTKGVDAFCLTYLRAERQIRKVFTHLVFQSEAFHIGNSQQLRRTLYEADNISFKGLSAGIECLSGISLMEMVGAEFRALTKVLQQAKEYRDKLFHGQLPDSYVPTEKFLEIELGLRTWCKALATGAENRIGYNGFSDSHCKCHRADIVKRVSAELPDLAAYAALLKRLRH